jgi:hypothetical protein
LRPTSGNTLTRSQRLFMEDHKARAIKD